MVVTIDKRTISLTEFLQHPPENCEWVDGELREKNGMTLRHSQIQARLSSYWRNYLLENNLGGEVYTEQKVLTGFQISVDELIS